MRAWGGGRCLLSGGYCLYYLGEGAGVQGCMYNSFCKVFIQCCMYWRALCFRKGQRVGAGVLSRL